MGHHYEVGLQHCRSHKQVSTWLEAPRGVGDGQRAEEQQGRLIREAPGDKGDQPDRAMWSTFRYVRDLWMVLANFAWGTWMIWLNRYQGGTTIQSNLLPDRKASTKTVRAA